LPLEVQRHNLITDPLPEQAFDLVHSRLLLMHLPKRDQALAKLIRAAKPGGWILLEEFDSLSLPAHASVQSDETTLKSTAAFRQYLFSRGVDLGYGRRLASLMRSRGLENVRAEGSLSMWQGGSVGARFVKATYQELREALLQTGALSEQEFEQDLEKLEDRGFICPSPIMWTTAEGRSDALR
jgi:SAM-dependent methyltransferase